MLFLELGVAAGNQVALRTGPFWGGQWDVGIRGTARDRCARCGAPIAQRTSRLDPARSHVGSDRATASLCCSAPRSPRIIDGNVAGTTEVVVADANKGPGVLNKEGIPVIFVNGPGVTGDEVLLEEADRYRLLQLRPVL
jgi:hypothetical protein